MVTLIGRKLGMTQLFAEDGALLAVTLVHVDPNTVVAHRTDERDGYEAVVLGAGPVKPERLTRPVRGQFKNDIAPTRHLLEVRGMALDHQVGDALGVGLFSDEAFVDVRGTSKGKGFQGVMKRHNFRGGRKTHGSKFHRAPGSTGQSATPSKVHKGKKMPGRMGGARTTVHNVRVLGIDEDRQLLMLGGALPGRRGGTLMVSTAKKGGSGRTPLTSAFGTPREAEA